MVSKDLFLRVHHITSYWRVLVLDWIRQLLRNHAPFDVRRRLRYEFFSPGWHWRWSNYNHWGELYTYLPGAWQMFRLD